MGFDYATVGMLGVLLLLVLVLIGCHLAVSFLIVGAGGLALLIGPQAAISVTGETLYNFVAIPTFSVLPMFMLMGAFAARGGFAKTAFEGVYRMAARIPASLAIATAFGCAVFGAICGSTMATAAVFGKLAYPAMRKYNYDRRFALGSIASAGTFACMIPPSGMFIIFAMFTGLSVVELFFSGIIPGILTACVYAISMYLRARFNPTIAPINPEEYTVTVPQRIRAGISLWPILVLAGVVLGGLYTGIFTATEAGAVGALGAMIFGLVKGDLRQKGAIRRSLQESAQSTSMIVIIVVTAMVFSRFLAITQIPTNIAEFLLSWDVHRNIILLAILGLWFVMGMFMAQTAIFALTLPILFPVIIKLGFNPVWFCIIAMKLNEIAAVSPPVGMNVFGLVGAVRDIERVTIEDAYWGCFPFILCDLVVVTLLFLVPDLTTWLPNLMLGR